MNNFEFPTLLRNLSQDKRISYNDYYFQIKPKISLQTKVIRFRLEKHSAQHYFKLLYEPDYKSFSCILKVCVIIKTLPACPGQQD